MDFDSQVDEARRALGLPEPRRPRKVNPNRVHRGQVKALTPGPKRESVEKRRKLKALQSQVTDEKSGLRYALAKFDPDLPDMLDRYIKAIGGGDLSVLDQERAVAFATKALIRKQAAEKILEAGAAIEEDQHNSDGDVVGTKLKAHPLLEPLGKMDEQLGYTAEQERLTKRSQGQGARDDALTARLRRDVQLRAANKLGLPAPDPEILREEDVIDTPEVVTG